MAEADPREPDTVSPPPEPEATEPAVGEDAATPPGDGCAPEAEEHAEQWLNRAGDEISELVEAVDEACGLSDAMYAAPEETGEVDDLAAEIERLHRVDPPPAEPGAPSLPHADLASIAEADDLEGAALSPEEVLAELGFPEEAGVAMEEADEATDPAEQPEPDASPPFGRRHDDIQGDVLAPDTIIGDGLVDDPEAEPTGGETAPAPPDVHPETVDTSEADFDFDISSLTDELNTLLGGEAAPAAPEEHAADRSGAGRGARACARTRTGHRAGSG